MREIPHNDRATTKPSRRWLKLAFIGYLCIKLTSCVLMRPGPWGPSVGGSLPNGHQVYFEARPVCHETDDRLTWISPSGQVQHFWVDQIHAGFNYVTIKFIDNGDRVWVEADGHVGASIDLMTADFRAEHSQQHLWATMDAGTKLAAGYSGSVVWLLCP